MEGSALKKIRPKLMAPMGLPPPSTKPPRGQDKESPFYNDFENENKHLNYVSIRGMSRPGMGRKRDYHPIHWTRYFTSAENVVINEEGDYFHVYRRGSVGPLLVLLHGGGFSGLTWALFAVSKIYT